MLFNFLAVIFALASALVVAWGTVVRQKIASSSTVGTVMRTAIRTPLWWVGTASAVVAYVLQIIALGFGTLLIVQPILVLSLMFTLPLAAWYQKRRMSTQQIIWCTLLTVAVGIIIVLGRPAQGVAIPAARDWFLGFLAVIAAIAALVAAAAYFARYRALLLGTACGVIYGLVAVLAKNVVDGFLLHGITGVLTSWPLWVLVTAAGTGTVMQQYSFQAGPLHQSLPAMTIFEPLVAFGLGIGILHERFQIASSIGWTVMVIALFVMIIATIVLSHQPLQPTASITHSSPPRSAPPRSAPPRAARR